MPPCPTGRGGIPASCPPAAGRAGSGSRAASVEASRRGPHRSASWRATTTSRSSGRCCASGGPDCPMPRVGSGSGSDVLGLDDATSRDHDWGLRLNLLVPGRRSSPSVDATSPSELPDALGGPSDAVRDDVGPGRAPPGRRSRPPATSPCRASASTRRASSPSTTGSRSPVRPCSRSPRARSSSTTRASWTGIRRAAGVVSRRPLAPRRRRRLGAARRRSCPSSGARPSAATTSGSRVIAARLAGVAMHLGHLLERRWPPYAKWLGTSFARLPRASGVAGPLEQSLAAADWREREVGLAEALRALMRLQRRPGCPRRGAARALLGPALPRRARGGDRRARGSR